MTDRVRVVVGANAAGDARQFVALAGQLDASAKRLAASSAALAEQSGWSGAAANRFRQDRGRMAALLGRMTPAVERMAKGAQSVIDDIDREDATGAAALPSAQPFRPGPAVPQGARPPVVHGWNGPGKPTVNAKGAFQPDHGHGDHGVEPPIAGFDLPFLPGGNPIRALALTAYAESIRAASYVHPGPDASDFFQHYLNNSGRDLHFDSVRPYDESGTFRNLVDTTTRALILDAQNAGQDSFDSGYVYNAAPFKGNGNWTGAIGGSFYRVVGHRTPQGTWLTTLQISSRYQFVPGANFGPLGLANGRRLHELSRMGLAQNFFSLGSGTLEFDANGHRVFQPPKLLPGPKPE